MNRGFLSFLLLATTVCAQTSADFAQHFANEYRVIPNVVCVTATGMEQELGRIAS